MELYKKAVMFSIDARIKKYCNAELVSVFSILYKRGAMFGLDARIALAIFGVLSVITGAALLKSREDAKVTQTYYLLKTTLKNVEAHYIDTGRNLEYFAGTRKADELFSNINNDSSWKGPYLGAPFSLDTSTMLGLYGVPSSASEGSLQIGVLKMSDQTFCEAGNRDCATWARIFMPDGSKLQQTWGADMCTKLDKKFDDAIWNKGQIRCVGTILSIMGMPTNI